METLADVWSLPLSRGILALLLTAALPVHWLHVFALVCAAIALVYVLESALLGDEPLQDLAALAAAPAYLLWKAAITPLVLLQSTEPRRMGADQAGGAAAMNEIPARSPDSGERDRVDDWNPRRA